MGNLVPRLKLVTDGDHKAVCSLKNGRLRARIAHWLHVSDEYKPRSRIELCRRHRYRTSVNLGGRPPDGEKLDP
jgi:hypothetical protein